MLRSSHPRRRSRLSRSRSSASIHSTTARLEHIDPIQAERDAHLAATLCYRPGHEYYGNGGIQTFWDKQGVVARDDIREVPEYPQLHRRQSIRFVNDDPGPRREGSRPSLQHQRTYSCYGGETQHHFASGASTYRPYSRASTVPRPPTVSSYTHQYVDSLQVPEKYQYCDDRSSAPSTTRQLRKSRSMFVPSSILPPPPAYYFSSKSSGQPDATYTLNRPSQKAGKTNRTRCAPSFATESSALRSPRSMTFLKTRRDLASSCTSTRQENNDLAIQLAREKFREQVEKQQGVKQRSSMLFRSSRRMSGASHGFRKSLRSSSNTSAAISAALSRDSSTTAVTDAGFRKKARNVSNGLKTRLKGLFQRGKSEEECGTMMTSPSRSADATESEAPAAEETDVDDDYMNAGPPKNEQCSTIHSVCRVPSLHRAASTQQLRSRHGSMESIRDETRRASDEKSRVTSWTSSGITTANSDNGFSQLTVIKEAGPPRSNSIDSGSVYSDQMAYSPSSKADLPNAANISAYSPAVIVNTPSDIDIYSPAIPDVTPTQGATGRTLEISSTRWKGGLSCKVSAWEDRLLGKPSAPDQSVASTTPKTNTYNHVREMTEIENEEPMQKTARPNSAQKLAWGLETHSSSRQSTRGSPYEPKTTMLPPPIPARSVHRPLETMPALSTALQEPDSAQPIKLARGNPVTKSEFAETQAGKENDAPVRSCKSVSPVKLVRRTRLPQNTSSAKSTPLGVVPQATGLGSPMPRGGTASEYSQLDRWMKVASSSHIGTGSSSDPHELQGVDGNTMGSQRMVELFLSSRRRHVDGASETGSFL